MKLGTVVCVPHGDQDVDVSGDSILSTTLPAVRTQSLSEI